VLGCLNVRISSEELGEVIFSATSSTATGRQIYEAVISTDEELESKIYLYHTHTSNDERSGVGRWQINAELGVRDHAMAYVDSWAVSPVLIAATSDEKNFASNWMVPVEEGWEIDTSISVECVQTDNTFYFESSLKHQPGLSGFYVESNQLTHGANVYVKIREHEETPLFFFKLENDVWMIGEKAGEDAGLAFVTDASPVATKIKGVQWRFIGVPPPQDAKETETEAGALTWVWEDASIVTSTVMRINDQGVEETQTYSSVYEALRFVRAIKFIPDGQQYYTLRNNVPMPLLGLGTGGLYQEEAKEVIKNALNIGYRSLDLAREYKNEHIVGDLLFEMAGDESFPNRADVFIETKVWPTDLGFRPTRDAVSQSLFDLKTSHVDLYMLHWPSCNKDIEWMHCDDAVDPNGTWQESWRALEKEYAEGRVQSIGVSNFHLELLKELESFATVLPHAVQNWGEPGTQLDTEVRRWCKANEVIYQPYASLRNLSSMSKEMREKLSRIARNHDKSEHAVALRFFLQTGASAIPRSNKPDHLAQNLEAFSWSLENEDMEALGWFADKEGDEL